MALKWLKEVLFSKNGIQPNCNLLQCAVICKSDMLLSMWTPKIKLNIFNMKNDARSRQRMSLLLLTRTTNKNRQRTLIYCTFTAHY